MQMVGETREKKKMVTVYTELSIKRSETQQACNAQS